MDDVPEKYLGQLPRDLQERIEYLHFWITRTQLRSDFEPKVKARLLRSLGVQLEKTEKASGNEHECACCGIILRVSASIGPECEKHPGKFPCNKFRGGSVRRTPT
jgi:hypothetical protein